MSLALELVTLCLICPRLPPPPMRHSTSPLSVGNPRLTSAAPPSHSAHEVPINEEERQTDTLLDAPIGARAEVAASVKRNAVPAHANHTREWRPRCTPPDCPNFPAV